MHMAEENYRVLTHLCKLFLDINGYADDTTLLRNQRGIKEPFDEDERGKWKCWIKTQHSKNKIMATSPINSWQIDGEKNGNSGRFYFLGL